MEEEIKIRSATASDAAGIANHDQSHESLIGRVDHIVYATPELNRGTDEIERLLGVRAAPGGQHPGLGTRNAVVALGAMTYLEIIAPDPDQPDPKQPRLFGLDDLAESKLAAWFIRSGNLETLREDALRNGVKLGDVRSGNRRRPDGVQLSWEFTDPWSPLSDGIIPFFIDWGDSPHPAETGARGATLVSFHAEHPEADDVRRVLRKLGVDLPVEQGPRAALIAVIEGARGRAELR
jgi:hypothetical protein